MKMVLQIIADIIGWVFGVMFMFLALGLFMDGSIIGGLASLLFGLGVTPARRKVLNALGIDISAKANVIALMCLFLVSCGSLGSVASDTELVEQNQNVIEQTEDSSDVNEMKVEESVIEDAVTENTEQITETIVESADSTVETEIVKKTPAEDESVEEDSEMQVHFLNVGQGDATLIISGEHAMLIDAGDDSKGTAVQLYMQKQGIEKLDYLVLTHTDADHIGGADVIINKFDVMNVFLGDFPKDSAVYRDLMQALEYKGLSYSTPPVGENYAIGDAIFTILAPNNIYSDPNNTSIALLLQNGTDRFVFSGDAEAAAECDILANGINIDCDVFKAGHHGSKTSNSIDFLTALSPMYAVISCAEGNSYGHPNAEVLTNLRGMNVKVFRTDEQGTIVATSNGNGIKWNAAPSETWKAGEGTENSVESDKDSPRIESQAMENEQAEPEPESESETEQETKPEPDPVPPGSDQIVWKSETGTKYHSHNSCGNMNPNKATQMTRAQAEAQGLQPCKKCF